MRTLFTACHKRNTYKLFIIRIIFVLLIIHSNCIVATAQYPVRSQTIIKSPYSAALTDYYTGSDPRLQLILTNTDIRDPVVQARLQLNIISNRVNIRSRTFIGPIIELDAGVPVFLSGTDLAIYFNPANIDVLSGLDYNSLFQTPRLPDGTYTIRFDVVEAFNNRLLSDPKAFQAPINILSSDPPFLNLPNKGDNIRFTDPLNIIFSWTPRALIKATTEYEFSLYEIYDNGIPPENAPFMSQPIYQTTTQTTTLLYGPTEPPLLPGKKYAWRIRAVAKQGIDSYSIYNNNGYTETYWFQLNDNCDPITQISATVRGGAVTLEWPENPNMYEYTVEYRKKGDWNLWHSTTTKSSKVIITNVAAGNTYEYRVGGTCAIGAGATFSNIRAFTIPPRDSISNKQCSILPNINISNQKILETLNTGESVKVGDYPATILSVTSAGNGAFSGTAALTMNILNIIDAKIKVSFSNVVFNTDKQLIKGFMVTSYDKTGKQIGDLDEVMEGGGDVGKVKDGRDAADITVDFPINNPSDIHVQNDPTDSTIQIDITGASGETKKVTVESLPTTIKDSEGNIYNIDKNGKVTKVGKSGEFKNLNTAQLNTISVDKAVVSFVPHDQQQYAFDQWKDTYNKSQLFKEKYELLSGDYHVSAKAIEAAKTDLLKAKIDIKDRSIKPDSVRFITGKGTRFESKYVGNKEYEITIVGGPAGDAQELYALYPNSSSNGGYLSFGKLLIASYPHKKQKLILVPVNGTTVDKNSIAQQLNTIYNKIAVEFDVQQDENFNDNSWDMNNDGALQVDGSGLFSTLTDEMEGLNNAYRNNRTVEEKTIYLFVLSKASRQDVAGDMPRNKQFGYLFSGSDGKTVAHEVGHGLFSLKHTFDSQYGFEKGELGNNVMDYPSGSTFSKLQWNAIHDPGLVIGLFESDGDAMYSKEMTKECSSQEIISSDNLLKTIINSTDAGSIADVINKACPASIKKLSYSQIEKLIDNISLLSSITEKYEVAVLRLMEAISESDYELFYTYLGNNKNKKLIHFVSEIDDKSINPLDGNNYTRFINTLCKISAKLGKFDEAGDYSHLSKIIDVGEIKFKASEFTNFNSSQVFIYKPGIKRFNCEYNENGDGKIKIYEEEKRSATTYGEGVTTTAASWDKIVDYATVSPLTSILLIKSSEELPLVNTVLDDPEYAGNLYIVPAIFLKYRKDKIQNDVIEKSVMLTLDAATLAASGAAAFAAQIGKVRRIWAMIEMAGALGNIGVNTELIPTHSKLGKAVEIYNTTMLIVGVKHLAVGSYKATKNIVDFVSELRKSSSAAEKILAGKGSSIRSLIADKYADWKNAINSIDNLSDAEKQLILKGKASQISNTTLSNTEKLALEEQHKAWKVMGVAEEIANTSKLTLKQIEEYAKLATKNSDKRKVMLGKYVPNNNTSYEIMAGKEYTFYQLDNWDEVYRNVGNDYEEMWKLNQKFLDDQISSGKEFYFSHDPFSPVNATGYAREINYLIDKGVKDFIKEGNIWKAIW